MENDNIYINDGEPYVPAPPISQLRSQNQKRDATLAQLPLLKEITERLQERIDFYNSVDSIPADVHTKPSEFMHCVAANKLTRDNLIRERSYLIGRIDSVG